MEPLSGSTEENINWYRRMANAYDHLLTEEDKKALREWEQENLDGDIATSDWPGWEAFIGFPPWKWREN